MTSKLNGKERPFSRIQKLIVIISIPVLLGITLYGMSIIFNQESTNEIQLQIINCKGSLQSYNNQTNTFYDGLGRPCK